MAKVIDLRSYNHKDGDGNEHVAVFRIMGNGDVVLFMYRGNGISYQMGDGSGSAVKSIVVPDEILAAVREDAREKLAESRATS